MTRLIAVTGAVAAGATTLAKRLALLKGWNAAFEVNVETENPFFSLYHKDPHRYAFHNQVAFLTQSAEAHQGLRNRELGIVHIQDFTPFEHVEVYAHVQHRFGWLSADDYTLVRRLAAALDHIYVVPEVLVFRELSVPEVRARVAERGRPSEQELPTEFLEAVLERFESWAREWRRCPIVRVPSHIDVREDTPAVNDLILRIDGALWAGDAREMRSPSA